MSLLIIGVILFLIYIGQKFNKTFQFHILINLFLFFMFWITPLHIPIMLFRGRDVRNGVLPCYVNLWVLKWVFNIEFVVTGLENICKTETVMLLNHQSVVDCGGKLWIFWWHSIIYISFDDDNYSKISVVSKLVTMYGNISLVIKKVALYLIPYGPGLWLCDSIFIERNNTEAAKKTLSKTLRELKHRKV